MSNYQLAQKYYLEALEICQNVEDKQGIAKSYLSLGAINLRLKSYEKACEYFENALDFSKRIGYKEAIKSSYGGLEKLDSTLGNWEGAYQNQKLFSLYSDSLINEENTRQSMYASMNFAFEKKETALKDQQKEEKRKQFIIIISVSLGLVFALLLAFIILRSLRRNQKQNKIITAQKELVEKQKQLVEEKQKEISDSINYAERIQRSFMATTDLLTSNLPDHFVFFQPKDVVSGDFYWAANLPNGSFLLATADSTGHGVPGAIMSILNISCLENAVEEKQLIEPAEILNHTRTKIIERLKKDGSAEGGKDGMDCSLIRFDLTKNQLVYAAANNPIWIVRQGNELIELVADRKPVGKGDKDQESFTQHTIQLQKNDLIYAITDGLPDQFGGPRGKKFLYKQLKEILLSIANQPLEQQKIRLKETFLTWKGDLEQVDDICIIGVRI
jgi:serine phosphatase RsbU (regulator of sigma subunit)